MLYDQRDKRWADLKYETLFITKKLKRFIFSELAINLQGVGPGILTLSPVPYEEILKFFFANTECVSIDRFMLLEQTTAMLSLTILKKILEKINLQKCLQREVFIKFFYYSFFFSRRLAFKSKIELSDGKPSRIYTHQCGKLFCNIIIRHILLFLSNFFYR